MRLCVFVCGRARVRVRMCLCARTCMCACVRVCAHACVRVCETMQCTFKTSNKKTLLEIYNGGTYGYENWALAGQHERKTDSGNEF